MRIKSIHLKNFKRFTDLLIKDIPETAKLVVVVGPNGCGKSSLFDGIWYEYRRHVWQHGMDETYYRKDKDKDFNPHLHLRPHPHQDQNQTQIQNINIEWHNEDLSLQMGDAYVRTAYRNDPDFHITRIENLRHPSNNERIKNLIQTDQTVEENCKRLITDTTAALFNKENDPKTVEELREELIGAVRNSMRQVFGDLLLEGISNPLQGGTFLFTKGTAQSYYYKNLSGGEKSAFDLILDLHIKKSSHPRAIYCIDETETHLHTRVQGKLIKELVNIIPDEGQLWITTHSLGVLRACQEIKREKPESVAVIDFDGVNLDQQIELSPVSLNQVTWDKLLSIALDDFSPEIVPKTIILCEGSPDGKGSRENFDAEIYSKIFDEHALNIQFISAGSSSEVDKTAHANKPIIQAIAPKTRLITLIDLDDQSEEEIKKREVDGDLVLAKRNLESYLFADDILKALAQKEEKPDLIDAILTEKQKLLDASITKGNPHDNFKPIAGELYVALKRILSLTQCGNNVNAFMRDTLAPLITPETDTYKELKKIIIDGVNATLQVQID